MAALMEGKIDPVNIAHGRSAEVLALKHESRILRQLSNPVSGSRKSQASSMWAKQHGA